MAASLSVIEPALRRWICLGAVCLLGACSPSSPSSTGEVAQTIESSEDRPDVVVLLLDTLRPDHLELDGYERENAPFLHRLSQRSLVFSQALSTSSWTAPATASLFTGVYPPRHGIVEGMKARTRREDAGTETLRLRKLPEDLPLLSEVFKRLGYRTYGLVSNLNIAEEFGYGRGFDRYAMRNRAPAEKMSQVLRSWKGEMLSQRPYFLYAHFMDPHAPYQRREPWYQPQEDRNEDARRRYESEIRYLDGYLRRLSSEFGWQRNCVLVVLSDHGEEFQDHGGRGHGFSLHREVNRVLFLLQVPGGPARTIDDPVSLVDVLPTLVELVRGDTETHWQGRSLAALWEQDRGEWLERPLFAHRAGIQNTDRHLWAVRLGDWKFLECTGEMSFEKLYNLRTDPLEKEDLAAQEQTQVRRLRGVLEEFRKEGIRQDTATVDLILEKSTLQDLRELGYVEEPEVPEENAPR
jgi:arylsulfatase A-like enzyme